MAAMKGRFRGVSFHLRRCSQEVASVLDKKTPSFGFQRSKLDHLTVTKFKAEFWRLKEQAVSENALVHAWDPKQKKSRNSQRFLSIYFN
jgi:hypothetical protein